MRISSGMRLRTVALYCYSSEKGGTDCRFHVRVLVQLMASHGADTDDDHAVRKFRGRLERVSVSGRVPELSRSFDVAQSRMAML